ncbi:hypothetical protein EVA_09349 [gut metagenome]|uniref:Uncharacterized protein n=1 Tax=gut metagenome TaxID=749906 RepID=J9CQX9_9ZZZZ
MPKWSQWAVYTIYSSLRSVPGSKAATLCDSPTFIFTSMAILLLAFITKLLKPGFLAAAIVLSKSTPLFSNILRQPSSESHPCIAKASAFLSSEHRAILACTCEALQTLHLYEAAASLCTTNTPAAPCLLASSNL